MSKKASKRLYEELLQSEPLGFVDPLHGLGTFDGYHMKFKEPVEDLKSPWSGDPYLPEWQHKISEMRQLYLKWQKALVKENKQLKSPTRHFVTTESVRKEQKRLIRIGINFGFRLKTISKKTGYAEKTLRNSYSYSRNFHQSRKNSYVIVKNKSEKSAKKIPFKRYLHTKEGKDRYCLVHRQ
ncbi:modification methylase Sau96I [Ligilactobacillus faecis]|uniref:Modification methylase Sau96I n=1 Tax=Ligilactobacillus faecis TaxID=762833 RepID=A0ABV4DLT5_9LACO